MRRPFAPALAAAGALLLLSCNKIDTLGPSAGGPGTGRLERFASAGDFRAFLGDVRERQRERDLVMHMDVVDPQAPPPPPTDGADAAGQALIPLEITNNQTVGIDEGGIVKQVGRFLVVLQDGRLFSADLGDEAGAPLRLVDRVNVYRPGGSEAWYDEMLVSGNRILVTAYSYEERASEISVFRIDSEGSIAREGRFLLSSDDYFSTGNYATRLVGDMLVLYAPVAVTDESGLNLPFNWPRLRRADGGGEAGRATPTLAATDIDAPVGPVDQPVLHTVSICPLREQVECRTTGFVGGMVQAMFVSPTDAFLWLDAPDRLPSQDARAGACQGAEADAARQQRQEEAGLVYRVPLDGGAIGAVAADGFVADQFALDSRDGRFRAVVSQSAPCVLPATVPARRALLDIPLSAFGGDVRPLAAGSYVPLPDAGEGQLRSRFLQGWLLYGVRADRYDGRPAPAQSRLVAVPLAAPQRPAFVDVPHDLVRIERAGRDAILAGTRGESGLALSYLRLDGAGPVLASTALLAGRHEGEIRSHAFGATVGADGSGLVGIASSRHPPQRLWSDEPHSSDLSFLTVSAAKAIRPAGEVAVRRARPANGYRCEMSCVEWYGNSRPIFSGGRVFALMGTELVEARLSGGRVTEVGRLDLTGRPMVTRAVPPPRN